MERCVLTLQNLAQRTRSRLLDWHLRCGTSHLASSLSCLDILSFIFRARLDPLRDRLVLSKGHAASALYVILAEENFLPWEALENDRGDGSALPGHVPWHLPAPVLCGSGSLGYGLGVAAGWAWAERDAGGNGRVFVICSDGELNTGVFWESLLSLSHHGLKQIEIYIDLNGQQALGRTADVLNLGDLEKKFSAFGTEVCLVDGHSAKDFLALPPLPGDQARVVICRTQKGKGCAELEALDYASHYRSLSSGRL